MTIYRCRRNSVIHPFDIPTLLICTEQRDGTRYVPLCHVMDKAFIRFLRYSLPVTSKRSLVEIRRFEGSIEHTTRIPMVVMTQNRQKLRYGQKGKGEKEKKQEEQEQRKGGLEMKEKL